MATSSNRQRSVKILLPSAVIGSAMLQVRYRNRRRGEATLPSVCMEAKRKGVGSLFSSMDGLRNHFAARGGRCLPLLYLLPVERHEKRSR
jgi:hypothetical protein